MLLRLVNYIGGPTYMLHFAGFNIYYLPDVFRILLWVVNPETIRNYFWLFFKKQLQNIKPKF